MILAYPYFRRGSMIYYVYRYDEDDNRIYILSYDTATGYFEAVFKRTITDNKVTLEYRPKRITVHMDELNEVEE